MMRFATIVLACAAVLGCGPTDPDAGGGTGNTDAGVDPGPGGCQGADCLNKCPSGTQTTISGRVVAPNGTDPVPKALVYVPKEISEFPDQVRCEVCGQVNDIAVVSTQSDVDGTFTLGPIPTAENAQPGFKVQLVAQIGRFRKLVEYEVQNVCEGNLMAQEGLRLPGRTSGFDHVPNIAVANGDYDVMECVLLKLGLENGSFDLYNGIADPLNINGDPNAKGKLEDLVQDLDLMKSYNIIFLNCSGDVYENLLQNQMVRNNIEAYVKAGGRLYVTDWSYDYIEQVEAFSPIIDFGPDASGAAPEAPNAAAIGTGDIEVDAVVHDDGLGAWLRAVESLTGESIIDDQNRVHIEHFLSGWVMQMDVQQSDTSKVWLTGQVNGGGLSGDLPLTTTFDYQMCGRVLYSSYHTEGRDGGANPFANAFPDYCASGPLTPQERVLEYLIWHIADCITID